MKYIRTADGIYKITNEDLIKYYVENNHYCIDELTHVVISGAYKKTDENIKVADTIEELCDWFFLEGANGNPINYKKFYTAKRAKERMQIEHDLYGVIHVKGKGLIYVAKMNDKGWLELI